MDETRYVLAVAAVVAWPAAVSFWLIVHPLIGFWRRVGVPTTYAVMLVIMVVIGYGSYRMRELLLEIEYGTHWPLILLAIGLFGVSSVIEVRCRRQLSSRTLIGVPELAAETPGRLLTEGIYAQVRHPRYLGALVGGVATAVLTNYLAVYGMMLLVTPLLYLVIVLEERELVDRFGDAYREYQARVPRLWLRLGSPGA